MPVYLKRQLCCYIKYFCNKNEITNIIRNRFILKNMKITVYV